MKSKLKKSKRYFFLKHSLKFILLVFFVVIFEKSIVSLSVLSFCPLNFFYNNFNYFVAKQKFKGQNESRRWGEWTKKKRVNYSFPQVICFLQRNNNSCKEYGNKNCIILNASHKISRLNIKKDFKNKYFIKRENRSISAIKNCAKFKNKNRNFLNFVFPITVCNSASFPKINGDKNFKNYYGASFIKTVFPFPSFLLKSHHYTNLFPFSPSINKVEDFWKTKNSRVFALLDLFSYMQSFKKKRKKLLSLNNNGAAESFEQNFQAKNEYTASDIKVLEGLEAVRKRPGMYIGSTDSKGYHHLLWEVLDNAVDEVLGGHANEVYTALFNDGSVGVYDNGRGIPCDLHEVTKKSAIETVFTVLHAGAKFGGDADDGGEEEKEYENEAREKESFKNEKQKNRKSKSLTASSDNSGLAYEVSGGLHGVGISLVNALSKRLYVEVYRDKKIYSIGFSRGKVIQSLKSYEQSNFMESVQKNEEILNMTTLKAQVGLNKSKELRGTYLHFIPDPLIFKFHNGFDRNKIKNRLKELSFLVPNTKFFFYDYKKKDKNTFSANRISGLDTEEPSTETFFSTGGLKEYVEHLCKGKECLHPEKRVIVGRDEVNGVQVEVAMMWSFPSSSGSYDIHDNANNEDYLATKHDSSYVHNATNESNKCDSAFNVKNHTAINYLKNEIAARKHTSFGERNDLSEDKFLKKNDYAIDLEEESLEYDEEAFEDEKKEKIKSYVNTVKTLNGGTHVDGLKYAITKVFNEFAYKTGKIKHSSKGVGGEYLRERLCCVIHVKLYNAEFEGQTKAKLTNRHVKHITQQIVYRVLTGALTEFPSIFTQVFQNALQSKNAADAARLARNFARRKSSFFQRIILPGKLSDCSGTDPSKCEIFIVEGDSAAGSAKQCRDRRTQAILSLRGKILNVEKNSNEQKIYQNEELKALIGALGLTSKVQRDGKLHLDKKKLRYNRIIIMTDADIDGAHIRILLLTFFYRYDPSLIKDGHIYLSCPPLYKVTHSPIRNKHIKNFFSAHFTNPSFLFLRNYVDKSRKNETSSFVKSASSEPKKCSLSSSESSNFVETYLWAEEELFKLTQGIYLDKQISLFEDYQKKNKILAFDLCDFLNSFSSQTGDFNISKQFEDNVPKKFVSTEKADEVEIFQERQEDEICFGKPKNYTGSNSKFLLRKQIGVEEKLIHEIIKTNSVNNKVSKDNLERLKIKIQRYKGLGEMMSEELWYTTMNPEKRILKHVVINDNNQVSEIVDKLMGTNSTGRKSFIEENSDLPNFTSFNF